MESRYINEQLLRYKRHEANWGRSCSTQVKNIALFNFKLGLKPNYPDLYYIIVHM